MKDITPERWQRIRAILDEALEMPSERWTTFLDEACSDDPVLRTDVEALLAAEAEAGALLEAPVDAFAGDLLDEMERAGAISTSPEQTTERQVGPYRLLKEIGRGGMGAVYLAERADGQFEQRVAVKLLRRDLHTDDVIRRFLAERQILASLNHANIARLLDGGITEPAAKESGGGQPYFVMEYVEGLPLDAYCDAQQLSIEERLALFTTVCEATQYAHRNLVVHRDLKPSNILVTEDPGSGPGQAQVKLLDFGIAKLLAEQAMPEALPQTRTGHRWMTPEYAAPEQIRGETVTTATDVYQLGVVLYELLTGHRPFERNGRSLHEVEQAVLEHEPEKPSTAVTRLTERTTSTEPSRIDAEQVSRARSTQPERLRRTLQGDLDTIVLKALRKEPDTRYASAEAFLEDIKRYLAGLPVEARRGSRGYRARKFVRRHRWGVAASAAFVVLLAGFGLVYTVQVTQERNRVQLEAEKSAQVTRYLMGLFEANDPREARGDSITARELLARGLEQVETLGEQPEVQAQMLDVLGRVYQSLGQYDKAQPLLERALALRRTHLGEEHLDVAQSLHNLARVLRDKSDHPAAESLFRQALAIQRMLLGEEHPDVAITLNNLAMVLHNQAEFEATERLYREVLAMRRRLLGEEHPDIATSMNNLGLLLMQQGNYDQAEAFHREALAMRRKLLGGEHFDITYSLNNLALVLHNRGDYAAAESLYREKLAMQRKLLDEEHPEVALTMNNLATVLVDKGDYAAAEPLFREALSRRRALLDEGHHDIALSLYSLAHLLLLKAEYHEAEALLREAVLINGSALGEEHWLTAYYKSGLGECLTALERYTEAEPLLLEAHTVLQRERGDQNRYTQKARERLVALYEVWGRPDEADAYRALLLPATP